ncbi:MAG TPA: ABC-type transport auxiliary lipoprotein family protein [Burkholderiales bacterium]
MAGEPVHAKSVRVFATSVLAAMLVACAFERPSAVTPTSYDLGPPPVYPKSKPAISGTVLIPPVRAPAWLDDTDIVYRLLYEDSSRPQPYTMSRWAAEPASLLTDRLRTRVAAASHGVITPGYSASSDYTLRVELDDFSQRFIGPESSRGTLRARASLLSTRDRKLLAQREFDVDRESAPNAPGAVKALSEATDAFLEDLVKWAAQNARPAADEQTVGTKR